MTSDEAEDLLDRLGIEICGVNGYEIQAKCPAHVERTGHEDHNPSWWFNSDTGAHICFSCQFKGNEITLISYMQGITYEEAIEWSATGERSLEDRLAKALQKKEPVFKEVTELTEANLAAFSAPPESVLKGRGISQEAAARHGILFDGLAQCWILPIRDPISGTLWGWQEKGLSGRYFKNYPAGVQKSASLFGYEAYTGGDMVVVESPLDVARMASVGVLGGVSTYGSMVSHAQVNLIRGADRVIFAMDNDDAGRKSALALLDASASMRFECWFFDYSAIDNGHGECKDVGGMSKAEILDGLTNAKHSLHGRKAIRWKASLLATP